MLTLTIYILGVIFFVLIFSFTKLPSDFSKVTHDLKKSINIIQDPHIDDLEKEKLIQQASLKLIRHSFTIVVKGALTILAFMLPLWIADVTKLSSINTVLDFSLRWDVLLLTTLILLFAVYLRRKFFIKNRSNNNA